MTQREAFEAWATSQGINITDNGFGGYDSQWTEGALAGWEAAQEHIEEFDVRGILASNLKCWHRLTGEEATELVALLCALERNRKCWSDLYGKEHQARGNERDEMNHLYNVALEDLEKHRELLLHHLSVIDPLRAEVRLLHSDVARYHWLLTDNEFTGFNFNKAYRAWDGESKFIDFVDQLMKAQQ